MTLQRTSTGLRTMSLKTRREGIGNDRVFIGSIFKLQENSTITYKVVEILSGDQGVRAKFTFDPPSDRAKYSRDAITVKWDEQIFIR